METDGADWVEADSHVVSVCCISMINTGDGGNSEEQCVVSSRTGASGLHDIVCVPRVLVVLFCD